MKKMKLILATLGLMLGGFLYQVNTQNVGPTPVVTVYHSPTCGCCKKWIAHLEHNGFSTKAIIVDDVTPIKNKLNVPLNLSSCHTAVVDGYVIEGHVPASSIKKILSEKPSNLEGIAVPGMPLGSPGMEGAYKESFGVISFSRGAAKSLFMQF